MGSVLAGPPLRVLALVTDVFGEGGGIAQYNRDFVSALARSDGIAEVIVLPRRGTMLVGELPLRVRQLRPARGKFAYALAALRAAWTQRPFNVVFCGHLFMAPLAAVIARLLGAPLWIQVHGTDAWQELSGPHRRAGETATLITSVSRHTRRRLLAWVGIDPGRVKILSDTVDPRFRPGPKPDYLAERHRVYGKKVLLTVARLAASERYKGHDRVISILPLVLRTHPETVYLIVGDGDDRPRLEALAAASGAAAAICFAGAAPPEELPDYYRLSDVFVMPSTGEGFGIVFLEAMASGIAAIGGNRDGSLDPLADGALGRVVDPGDGEELAAAICAALDRPQSAVDRATRFKIASFEEHVATLVRSFIDWPMSDTRRR
jgi:phosphatidylinositol alpha-1,6-mannosyltransferase